MKGMFRWIQFIAAGAVALSLHAAAADVDRLKSDLIGQSMGGRDCCWKFQSLNQIKELSIKNKSEDSQKRVYTIALQLQAGNAAPKYSAEARVEYAKHGSEWKVKQVGLLSIRKMN